MVSAQQEEPFFFPSGGDVLVGIVTHPLAEAPDEGTSVDVLLASGGWLGLSTGRNRSLVRLARQLAARGLCVLRFEYRGVGDSTGAVSRFELGRPFVEDLRSALAGRPAGVRPRFLVGFCFGARTVLPVASELDGVKGVVLVAAPVHDGGRRQQWEAHLSGQVTWKKVAAIGVRPSLLRDALRVERRRFLIKYLRVKWSTLMRRLPFLGEHHADPPVASTSFMEPLDRLLRQGIRVLFVFGTTDAALRDFNEAKIDTRLCRILQEHTSQIEIVEIEGDVHGLGRVHVQEAVNVTISEWIERTWRGAVPHGVGPSIEVGERRG
jgi:pimeloyl-ACP methyl ester carboxylesterase